MSSLLLGSLSSCFVPFCPSLSGLFLLPGEEYLNLCEEFRKWEHGVDLWSAILADEHWWKVGEPYFYRYGCLFFFEAWLVSDLLRRSGCFVLRPFSVVGLVARELVVGGPIQVSLSGAALSLCRGTSSSCFPHASEAPLPHGGDPSSLFLT